MSEHHRLVRRALRLLAITALGGLLAAAGCSDEPSAKKPSKPAAGTAGKGKSSGKGKGKGNRLKVYAKVPDEYRHVFSERDFKPDLSGDENRDPFRSYTVRLAGTRRNQAQQEANIEITERCTKDNTVAPTYQLRDLRLVGIVLRGTKSWAVFTDRKQFGNIVRKGDCLGKEKARVEAIGAGFVRLEEIGAAAPGAAAPAPSFHDYQLHPEELTLEGDEGEGEGGAEAAPSATPGEGGVIPAPAPAPPIPAGGAQK